MTNEGIVGEHKGSKAREVLMSLDDWESMHGAPLGAGRQGPIDELWLRVDGQEHNVRPRPASPTLADRVDPVQQGHGDIGDDHVRIEGERPIHELASIAHGIHDVEVVLE